VGCSLAASLVTLKKELKRNHNPDFLFIEPSEMVVTQELRNVMSMALRDISFEIGPFITLINGPEFDFHWQERSFLMIGQMQGADLVAIAQSDLMDEQNVHELEHSLSTYASTLIPLSVPGNLGVNEVMAAVMGSLSESSI
jgi:G3E family GTPase